MEGSQREGILSLLKIFQTFLQFEQKRIFATELTLPD